MSSIIKVDTIQLADGTAATIENLGLATGALSHRNIWMNGAMQVAQRGTSFTSTGAYTLDRYRQYQTSGTFTDTQSTDAPTGFQYSYKRTNGTAAANGDIALIRHMIEGYCANHLEQGTVDAKDFTISFWVKSSVTGTYILSVQDEGQTVTYAAQYTINTADTWEKKTITIPGYTTTGVATFNTTTSAYMYVNFVLSPGAASYAASTVNTWVAEGMRWAHSSQVDFVNNTGATFQFTGVQLEVGSVATPFEHISYGEELAKCKRYFHRNINNLGGKSIGSGFFYNTTTGFTHYDFPVEMRTRPSYSYSSLSDFRVLYGTGVKTATSSGAQIGVTGARIEWIISGATTGQGFMVDANNTTGYIDFNAEL